LLLHDAGIMGRIIREGFFHNIAVIVPEGMYAQRQGGMALMPPLKECIPVKIWLRVKEGQKAYSGSGYIVLPAFFVCNRNGLFHEVPALESIAGSSNIKTFPFPVKNGNSGGFVFTERNKGKSRRSLGCQYYLKGPGIAPVHQIVGKIQHPGPETRVGFIGITTDNNYNFSHEEQSYFIFSGP
jgi:hypothetical protein